MLVGDGALHSSEAENVHAENTTVECSSVNSDWQQNLQVPGGSVVWDNRSLRL